MSLRESTIEKLANCFDAIPRIRAKCALGMARVRVAAKSRFKSSLESAAIAASARFFRSDELQLAYRKLRSDGIQLPTLISRIAFIGMKVLRRITNIDALASRYIAEVQNFSATPLAKVYDRNLLHLTLNRIYDLPGIEIDATRKRTVNVLVPAFDFRSMSAGFFGVFQIARFIKSCGYHARCVFFDNFYYNESEFRERFKEYTGLENIHSEMEMEYIGERKALLRVNPGDACVATVWYSAHFANKIMQTISGNPFVYLIQDYEANFFPGGTLYTQAANSYEFNYHALFSTKSLMDHFRQRGIDSSVRNGNQSHYFNNACSASLMPYEAFIRVNGSKTKRDLVYYARPVVNRNMFELGALALTEGVRQGVFVPSEWNFYSVGLGDTRIDLAPGLSVQQLPRMTLKEYIANIGRFDLGLSLMASAHPSLLPMDLAGSGAICVTNTFANKTEEYLSGICRNILAAPPELNALIKMLATGAERAKNIDSRYEAAREMRYPRTWDETFDDSHREFFRRVMNTAD